MAERLRFTWMDGLLLAAIIAAAAGTRAGYLITCADYARNDGPLRVETPLPQLGELVRTIKTQQRFALTSSAGEEQDTAAFAPGYPVLTAAVNRVVDDAALPSTMRWIQCGLGALTAGLYFLFARRAFASTVVAVLAGLLCALHPFWIIDTAALADGTTATFLLALMLFLGARASQVGGPLSSLLFGLSLGALALVRAALLPFALVGLAWFLWRSRLLVHGWLWGLLAFLGLIIGLGSWTFRNWQIFGEAVPIVDSTYYHLWVGNHPQATGGPNDDGQPPADPLGPPPRRTERDNAFAQQIRQEWHAHPTETVRRRLHAGLAFIFGEHWFSKGRLAEPTGSEEIEPSWLGNSYTVVLESTMLVLLVLGLLGWRWTYGWRTRAMPSSLAMIWIPLPYILSHAGALSGPRLPLDGVLLCYTAFALAHLLPGRRHLWDGERAISSESRP
jgi:4-amino-4-deoxy-L-arabinose transferase-like glycosyltransferase